MTLLKLSNLSWLALFAAMAASSGAACSNNPGPPPKAYFSGTIGPGNAIGMNDPSACSMQGDLNWQIGEGVAGKPTEYEDGSHQAGGAVSIQCSVDSSGSQWNISLSASITGMNGGTFTLYGTVNSSGTSSMLSGTFQTEQQLFRDNNCTFSLQYNGNAVPSGGAPASGRIWGHVDCPNATESGMFGINSIDGGSIPRTCDAYADFLFENCN